MATHLAIYPVVCAILLFYRWLASRRLRAIDDTPGGCIGSLSPGYVKVSGLARPHSHQIEAPLTGRPCVWYRYTIEEGDGGDDPWRKIEGGQSSKPFLLDDGSGQCLVDPAGSAVELSRADNWTGPYRQPRIQTPETPAPTHWYSRPKKQYRYFETRIEDGDTLFCLGRLEIPPPAPASFAWLHAPVLARLTSTNNREQPFVISIRSEEELATRAHGPVVLAGVFLIVLTVIAVVDIVLTSLLYLDGQDQG